MTIFAGDEAGHTSFNFEKGATRYFVVAFISTDQPDELRQAIARFRQEHSLPRHYEFSFYDATARGLKDQFFAMLAEQALNVRILSVDKRTLPHPFETMDSTKFYLFFMSEMVRLIPEDEKRGETLLLDEFGSAGKTIVGLGRTLKARGVSKGFKKIVAKRSRSEDLIQVADMVAGAALRQFEKGDVEYLRVVEAKISLSLRYLSI